MNKVVKPTTRAVVIQSFLDLFKHPEYLEIGVFEGQTFNALRADTKIGVDPKFQFEKAAFERAGVSLHEVRSDTYFATLATPDQLFDVIFIDGLHTAEQTLRDILNAQLYLKAGGVMIIDDIWPSSYIAAIRDLETHRRLRSKLKIQNPSWMGDVFKLLYFIDSFMQQFTMRLISDTNGQAILWRQPKPVTGDDLLLEISLKTLTDLLTDDRFRRVPVEDVLAEFRAFSGR
ncbi:MAG: class I SAM-dependent methyltransferase [Henriciella sp.]